MRYADGSRPTFYGPAALKDRRNLPLTGRNAALPHLRVGMYDYDSGLDRNSLRIEADFPVDGVAQGRNLAGRFREAGPGVWERKLAQPIPSLTGRVVRVSAKDRQGNRTRVERTFSVGSRP